MTEPHLLHDIRQGEGCRLVAYRDTDGYWTIGWGHLLDQSIDWTGHEITQETADAMLDADIQIHIHDAMILPEWNSLDTLCRQNAVIECVFNLGAHNWITEFPQTRSAIQAQNWAQAEANLLHSPRWIAEVGLKRVARIAGYLSAGSYSQ